MSAKAFVTAALAEINAARVHTLVRNKLIPASAIASRDTPRGIEYLHPTKGWRFVSYRRFGAYTA